MTIPETIKITYQDYLLLSDADKRYEVIDGRLHMVPSPTPYHQMVSMALAYILADFVAAHQLGRVFAAPLDVVLSGADVLQPDLLFISNERRHIITAMNIQGAPDLVIEILSPSTSDRDLTIKRKVYAQYGVPEYWIVSLEARTVELLRLQKGVYETMEVYASGDTLESLTFQGLGIPLSEIFAPLLEE
jgi:Uma2 family endonuclease